MRATAYCPGHITGFFVTREHRDLMRSGSRGAGLCVDRGVTTTVTTSKGSGKITTFLNGMPNEAPVTRYAAAYLLGDRKIDVTVSSALDLPVGEGFGMSAAGALSTAFALAEVLEMEPDAAWTAAHLAELENHTGLGDVSALHRGGVTFRRREGLPPCGRVDRIADDLQFVAGVVGSTVSTAEVLGDRIKRRIVNVVGRECYYRLLRKPTVDEFFRLSREFTERSGLETPEVKEALKPIDEVGEGAMVMLGNAVFARGDLDALEKILSQFGPTFRLGLDLHGPRVLVLED